MLATLAAAAMTATLATAPAPDAQSRAVDASATTTCKPAGRYEVADRALLYRGDGKARASALGRLPKANHEKAVLRTVDGCAAPVVVGYEVGR